MQLYLEHIVRETVHRHCVALEEVHPETLDYLRPLLRKTLDTGETVQLPHTAWYLHAQTRDGRLFVSLWWGIANSAPPLTMQVEQSEPPCRTGMLFKLLSLFGREFDSQRHTLAVCHHHKLRTLSAFGFAAQGPPFWGNYISEFPTLRRNKHLKKQQSPSN